MKAELSSTRFEEPPRQGEDAIIEDTMEGLSPIVADNNYNNDMFLQPRKEDVIEDSAEGLPPLLADDDDDDGDNHGSVTATNCINENVKPPSESSIVNNPLVHAVPKIASHRSSG